MAEQTTEIPIYDEDGNPLLDENGNPIVYYFHDLEYANMTGTANKLGDVRTVTVTNTYGPGDGMIFEVEKIWLDDGDTLHRHPVNLGLFYTAPGGEQTVVRNGKTITVQTKASAPKLVATFGVSRNGATRAASGAEVDTTLKEDNEWWDRFTYSPGVPREEDPAKWD